jgi:hypothetical protein
MAYHFRLRIRNAADSADQCVFSSLSTDTYPHIVSEPTGDGQEFNPLTGRTTVGAYVIDVADAVVSGSTRTVTQFLVDASLRQQLIGRRAFIEYTTNGGGAWNPLMAGYVNRIALVTAQRFSFTIGEARRIEERLTIFKAPTAAFNGFTNLLGPPFLAPWGRFPGGDRFPPTEPWDFQVSDAATDEVALRMAAGSARVSPDSPDYVRNSGIPPYAKQLVAQLFRPDFVRSQTYAPAVPGTYPNISVFVKIFPNGTIYGPFEAFAFNAPNAQDGVTPLSGRNGDTMVVKWPGGSGIVSNGTFVLVWAYRKTITPTSPLHIDQHPIDIVTSLWSEAGLPYDAGAAATVREGLGTDSVAMLRITDLWRMDEFISGLGLYWGFGVRISDAGVRTLFLSRIQSASVPGVTLTNADLRSADSVVFEVDDTTVKNQVIFKELSFRPWSPGEDREVDEVVATENNLPYDNGEIPQYGGNDLVIAIPGTSLGGLRDALANELLDRFSRGGQYSTILCNPNVTTKVGEEMTLNLPQLPVGNVRGGTRIVQVVKRTPAVAGPLLRVLDAGSTAQASPVPAFTLAAGMDARKVVAVTFTNAAALNAAGLTVRVEWGFGGSAPAGGALLRSYGPGEVPASFTTPPVDAGTRIWMRMRSEVTLQRPSAFSAWQDLNLTDLVAPSAITFAQDIAADAGVITVRFTPGETDVPTNVYVRDQAQPAAADRLATVAPVGADRAYFTLVVGSLYTITLQTTESAPFAGVSTAVATNYTVPGSAPTLVAPNHPVIFSYPNSRGPIGSGGAGRSGVSDTDTGETRSVDKFGAYSAIGLSVIASTPYAMVEFQVAVETSPGSGVYGAFQAYALFQSAGTADRTEASLNVPLGDRLRRQLRARMSRDNGVTVSAFCATQTVDPTQSIPKFTAPTGGAENSVLVATGTGPWEYVTDGVTRSASSLPIANVVASEHAFASQFTSGVYALNQSYAQQAVATTGSLVALYGYADANHPSGTVVQIMGVVGTAEHRGAGAVTNARGLQGIAFLSGAGTTANAVGVHASVAKTGGGTITTAYGVKVEDITQGSTNYALHTGLGTVRFGGLVLADAGLTVTGTLTYTNLTISTLFKVQDAFVPTFAAQAIELTYSSAAGSGTTLGQVAEVRQTVATTGTTAGLMGYGRATHTSGTVVQIIGLYGLAHTSGVGGTTTNAVGVFGGGNLAAGTVTNYMAVVAGNPGGGATITNAYGLLVRSITVGATNWAIVTEGTAASSFGGALTVGGLVTVGLVPSPTNGFSLQGRYDSTTASGVDVSVYFEMLQTVASTSTAITLEGATKLTHTSGTVTTAVGVEGIAWNQGSANAGHLRAVEGRAVVSGTSTTDTATAIFANGASIASGTPTLTTAVGLYVQAHNAGTNRYGIYIEDITGGSIRWAIFTAGTTASSLGGALTVSGLLTANAGFAASGALNTITGTGTVLRIQQAAAGGSVLDFATQAAGGSIITLTYFTDVGDLTFMRSDGATPIFKLVESTKAATFSGLLTANAGFAASGALNTITGTGTVLRIQQAAAGGSVLDFATQAAGGSIITLTYFTDVGDLTFMRSDGATPIFKLVESTKAATFSGLLTASAALSVTGAGTFTANDRVLLLKAATANNALIQAFENNVAKVSFGYNPTNFFAVYDEVAGQFRFNISSTGAASFFGNAVSMGSLAISAAAMTADSVILVDGTWTTSGSNRVGVSSRPLFDSSVTTGGAAFSAALRTATASFTMANGYGIYVGPGSKGAGSTITNHYGVYVDTTALGGTKNIGLHLQTPTGTGAVIIDTQVGAQLTAAGVWTDAPSYRHLKEEIQSLTAIAPQVLRELEPVWFRRKHDGRRAIHVIAEDYHAVMGRYGLVDEVGDGIAAAHLATLAIAGWQAHDARFTAVESRLDDHEFVLRARDMEIERLKIEVAELRALRN